MNTTLSFMKHTRLLFPFLIMALASIQSHAKEQSDMRTAIFAGGCFWCIEADFEKLSGVISVQSGYTGGQLKNPTYEQVSRTETGHYEAVLVNYDASKISYKLLVDYFWFNIDPTDDKGQFCDKGSSYRSAIFYQNEEQKAIAEQSLAELSKSKPFIEPIITPILAAATFYPAENYHQDYYKTNSIKYRYYRYRCGRDKRLQELWGNLNVNIEKNSQDSN